MQANVENCKNVHDLELKLAHENYIDCNFEARY